MNINIEYNDNLDELFRICTMHNPEFDENEKITNLSNVILLKGIHPNPEKIAFPDMWYTIMYDNIKLMLRGDNFGSDYEGSVLRNLYLNHKMKYTEFLRFIIKKFISKKQHKSYEINYDF